jgi:predicted permease
MIVATLGGALGVVLAAVATVALSTTVSVGPVQMDARAPSSILSLSVRPHLGAFGLAAALSIVTGILFGLAPALRGARGTLAPALMGRGGSSTAAPKRAALGRAFVVSQIALTLVLVVVTSLFVRSLLNLQSQPLGIDRSHLLLVWTTPGQAGRSGERLPDFVHTVLDSVARLPGVISANATNHGVLEGEDAGMVSELLTVDGLSPKRGLTLMRDGVTPGFFETAGMPILEGRDLNERDIATTPRVAVINETMNRFFFGTAGGIGRRIGSGEAQVEIVGVVKDAKHGSPRDRRGVWYVSYRQYPNLLRNMCIAVRTSGDPKTVTNDVRRALRDLDPMLPILRVDTIEEQLDDVLAQERAVAALSVGLGTFALLLASIGLYGVVANGVVRRTNEIGVRMALGAQRSAVVGMVLAETVRLGIIGLLVGTPLAVIAGATIANRLYDVKPSDPVTVAVAMSTLAVVTIVAGVLPAYRAARIDPNVALRYD